MELMKDCRFRRIFASCVVLASSSFVRTEVADGTVAGACVAAAEDGTGSGAGWFCRSVMLCGGAFVCLEHCEYGGESDVVHSYPYL